MDRLPLELWIRVCSLSDIRSLKRIRLINSVFNQIAARYLFEGLCVTLIPRYLDKVTEVAFHPTLRFYVRTLYFDERILDDEYDDFDVWKTGIGETDRSHAEGSKVEDDAPGLFQVARCSPAHLDRHYTNFRRLLASQKACFKGRMDLAMLTAALAMLPNLRTIQPMRPFRCHGTTPILSDIKKDTLLSDPFVWSGVSSRPGIARPLATLLSSLGLTRKQILTIDIGAIPWHFWENNGPAGFLLDVQQLIHVAFRYLENLSVVILVNTPDLEVRLQGLLPLSISNFIGAAQGLRRLDLGFGGYEDDEASVVHDRTYGPARNYPRVGQLFATLTLPNLAILHLHCCILTEKSLKVFLIRHGTTLKKVRIGAVVLDNRSDKATSWEKTLKHVVSFLPVDWVTLFLLYSDDIQNVVLAGDPDAVARDDRHAAYCDALSVFVLNRGGTECPRIDDFARLTV